MFHIAEDEYVPGNLLFVERHTIKTTDGTTTSLIAGSSTSYGYLEDVGANARFDDILSFVQLSKARVILTDSDNHCLRSVDRTTSGTSTYAGNCTLRGQRDGIDALLTYPHSIIVDLLNSTQLFITDYSQGSLKTINTVSKHVLTIYRDTSFWLSHMLQEPSTGNIYATFEQGIGLYDSHSNTFSVIAGSFTRGFLDGEIPWLRFNEPRGLLFLSRSQLLIADAMNRRLRVLDLMTNTSSSICSGDRGHTDGDLSSCQLDFPWSLLKLNNTIYIGEQGYIRSIQSKYHDNV